MKIVVNIVIIALSLMASASEYGADAALTDYFAAYLSAARTPKEKSLSRPPALYCQR